MANFTPVSALIGGALIGLAATTLVLANGRVAGISGILAGLLERPRGDTAWRVFFLLGMLAGGLLYNAVAPRPFPLEFQATTAGLVVAGLLVGFGARLGQGCTSGHGVCGIARLSPRSLASTGVFIAVAIVVVFATRHLAGA